MARATEPLSRLEKSALIALALVVVAFGVLTEYRCAFLSRRMGDLGCYLRGAWAVSSGTSMYDVVCDNSWHYNYPPLFAVLMRPFADPPAGSDAANYFPYAASVGVWYVLSVVFLVWGVHVLASALERHSGDPSVRGRARFGRRWWALRVLPVIGCIVPIGHTLSRGQVNTLILALLCGHVACLLDGRRFRAGLLLAVAVCIKVVPLYLLVFPVWKRDFRTLAGTAAGLFAGLVVIPWAALGHERAVAEYANYARVLFGPLLGVGDDDSRLDELLGVNATDAVGLKSALHAWANPDFYTRPRELHPLTTWAYRLIGVALTGAVLLAGGRAGWHAPRLCGGRGSDSPTPFEDSGRATRGGVQGYRGAVEFASLVVLMVILAPVSHLHYYTLALPSVMVLLACRWEGREDLTYGPLLAVVLSLFWVVNLLPLLPGFWHAKDLCLPLLGGLALLLAGIVRLRGAGVVVAAAPHDVARPRLAA